MTATVAGTPVEAPPSRGALPSRTVTLGAVALVVALGAWGIDRHALWLDEAVSLGATSQLGRALSGTYGTMAAYYVLLDGWTAVVGTSVVALRSLSVVTTAAVVVVAAALARRLLPRREGALAVLVLAASPALVRYGQEARSYALVTLVAVTAWWVLDQAVERHHRDAPAGAWWTGLAGLSVLGVLSHGLYPLQVIAMAVALATHPDRARLLRAALPALLAAVTTAAALASAGADRIADWIPPLSAGQVADLGVELVAPAAVPRLVLLALAAVGVAWLLRSPAPDPLARWRAVVPVIWAVVPVLVLVAVSTRRPYLVPRYLLASTPALAMLVAVGAVAAVDTLGRRARPALAAVTVGAVVVGALGWAQVAVHDRTGYDWRSAAERVAAEVEAGDAIAFTATPLRMPFEAAWRDVDPRAEPLPVGNTRPLGTVMRYDHPVRPETVPAALARADRLWVVHQTTVGEGDRPLEDLLADPAVRDRFAVVAVDRFAGGVQVLRLEAR